MKLIYAAALAAILPGCAMAKGFQPGLYDADGLQQICLQADGTWNSPTFASWGGQWSVVNKELHVFGNYNSGAGNNSIVVKGKKGSWTEWTDDLSYSNPLDPITFTYIGACTEARAVPGAHANPAQR